MIQRLESSYERLFGEPTVHGVNFLRCKKVAPTKASHADCVDYFFSAKQYKKLLWSIRVCYISRTLYAERLYDV